MATLGINDLKQYALPSAWDASLLRNIELEGGGNYEGLISEIATALNVANGDLLKDPLYGGLTFVTDQVELEYRTGVSNGFEPHTEYSKPDVKRAATTGHMLPLLSFDRAFGWNWDFIRKARRSQIEADIASGLDDLQNLFERAVLTRLFKSTYDSVGTGKSMPFADGGTADSTYVPVAVPQRGGTFTSSHNHFKFASAISQANLETFLGELWEHNYDAPFDMVISNADLGSWSNTSNVTGWKDKASPEIQYGANSNLARVDDSYVGAITTKYGAVRVRATGRIPTGYYSIFKSFGANDQRNPLRVRESKQFGLGAVLLAGDHIREYPIENAIMFSEFGVGVGESRVAAVSCRVHASAYADPTIS